MSLQTLYWVLAIFGGAVLVIRFVLFMIGLGDAGPNSGFEPDMDMDHDFSALGDHGDISNGMDGDGDIANDTVDHTPGIMSYLSLQSISGFFLMFGLVGIGTLQINLAPAITLICGLAAGIFTAWSVTKIYRMMLKLQSSGNMNIESALGKQGRVYLTIPVNGTGVVSINIQGSLRNLDALSADGNVIPTDSLVVVTKITDDHLLMVRSIENITSKA